MESASEKSPRKHPQASAHKHQANSTALQGMTRQECEQIVDRKFDFATISKIMGEVKNLLWNIDKKRGRF